MKGIKEAFIDAGEISQMLGIGMTKALKMGKPLSNVIAK